MASKTRTSTENAKETEEVKEITTETEKVQESGKIEAKEGIFIYLGPTLDTGLRKNAVLKGTREQVEKYLKSTLEKYPQAKMLLFDTAKTVEAQTKVRTAGTLLNKYYNDLLSLSVKR